MTGEGTTAEVLAGEARWALVHGDCREVLPTLPDKGVAHVISDPPYTQETSENARTTTGDGDRKGRAFITFDGVDGQEFEIMRESLRVAQRWALLFCAMEQLGEYRRAAAKEWARASVWYRTNPACQFTGDRPGQRCEGIAIAHRRGKKRWHRGGECWAPMGPTINSFGDSDRGTSGHPTPKPIWLMLECLDAFTDADELILDPFAGSGTTGVACLRLGRRFIGIERDEKYANVARERLRAEERGLSLREARAGQTSIFDALDVAP